MYLGPMRSLIRANPVVAAGAWTPDNLWLGAEAGGWWDASVLASMNQDSGGAGSAVAVDTDPVGYWVDQGPNAHAIIQATSDNRPLYKTSGGLHWLQFDGSNDSLGKAADIGVYGAGSATLMVALNVTQSASKAFASQGLSTSNNDAYWHANSSVSTDHAVYIRDNAATVQSDYKGNQAFTTATDCVLSVVDSGTLLSPYVNKTAGTADAYTRTGGSISFNLFRVGAIARGTPAGFITGRIYALIWIGRALDAGELTSAIEWLGTKAGLSL